MLQAWKQNTYLENQNQSLISIVWQTLNPNHKPLLRWGLRFWFQFCCLRFARFWFKLQNEVCDHVLSKLRHFHWVSVNPVYIHWQISTIFSLKMHLKIKGWSYALITLFFLTGFVYKVFTEHGSTSDTATADFRGLPVCWTLRPLASEPDSQI